MNNEKSRKISGVLAGILAAFMVAAVLAGCNGGGDTGGDTTVETTPEMTEEQTLPYDPDRYTGAFSEVNGAFGGIDDLGRTLSTDLGEKDAIAATGRKRQVGIFYFLWQGEHGTSGPYDNYKIATEHPEAVASEAAWLKVGGGKVGAHHFWGEPLFGYYTSQDTWVIRKHLQMLTDAGVDFIVFDATNAYPYSARVKQLISIWYKYYTEGVNVPKLAFYTNSSSGKTINKIYSEIYNNQALNRRYPRLSELWYMWDGKPMIIGDPNDSALSAEAKEYFRIKASVWPNAGRTDDGFPWMEFGRLLSNNAIYGLNGRREVVNVSIAQHSATCMMSATAWYGANDRTRSWHNGANDTSPDAVLYGYNFAEQWEWALSVDPEMIFITGWNEWVAQRQKPTTSVPIFFVDCCDPNTSRDAEPMAGLFGDNYYMQMAEYIRRYKGTAARVDVGGLNRIDITGDFAQWNAEGITARYTDYSDDTKARAAYGFGNIPYKTPAGLNDFVTLKAARDIENLYFYAGTADEIKMTGAGNEMTLFISSGRTDTEKWVGKFDFAVNLEAPEGDMAVLSALRADGTAVRVGTCRMKISGNEMMIEVPRAALGIPFDGETSLVDVEFKWADSFTREDGKLSVWSFYREGDAAPLGRMTYIFSEKSSGK